MASIGYRCGIIAAVVLFTILSAGEAHDELPKLDAEALGEMLIQRGGIAAGIEEDASVEPVEPIEQKLAEDNIESAEAKAMAEMDSPQADLAALETQLNLQVEKTKKKMKKGKGAHAAKKAASLAKKVLALSKKVKKDQASKKKTKKKKKKKTKKKKKAKSHAVTKKVSGAKAVTKDPISKRLIKARHDYMIREKKENGLVKGDEKQVSALQHEVLTLNEKLIKTKELLVKRQAALVRHRELHTFDLKAYQRLKAKEAHRKKMVWIKTQIRQQRDRVRKEKEEEEASNEQLQKFEERKKRLISYHAKRMQTEKATDAKTGKPTTKSSPGHVLGADAVAKAVGEVEKSIADSKLQAQLKPKVAHLKATLHGAALQTAVEHLVSDAVASKVNASLQKYPSVRSAITKAVTQLRHQLAVPASLGKAVAAKPVTTGKKATTGLAAKAKMQADAAVRKVQAARKTLNAANQRLSRAVHAAGHKGLLTFAELVQLPTV